MRRKGSYAERILGKVVTGKGSTKRGFRKDVYSEKNLGNIVTVKEFRKEIYSGRIQEGYLQ